MFCSCCVSSMLSRLVHEEILMTFRVDLCCCCRFFRNIHSVQCFVTARYMHCGFRRCGCRSWFSYWQYSYIGQDLVACLDRRYLDHHSPYVKNLPFLRTTPHLLTTSVLTLTIAVGLQERPAAAPQAGLYRSDYKIIGSPTFVEAMGAINSFIFAYAGTPAFFAIISEMREPKDYNKAMFTCQGVMTAMYLIVGIVVYYYCGSFVASPALGSAGPLLKRICYGLALPGLIVSTCLVTHYPAKYVFIRALKGSKHLVSNSKTHWATWLGCVAGVTVVAYIICSAVPNFGSLISLVGALLATFMSLQPLGMMWLYDNFKVRERDMKWMCGVGISVAVIAIGTYIMVAGSYAAIVEIINDYKNGSSGAWSCADNANSGGGGH